jgi:hypothetical protein
MSGRDAPTPLAPQAAFTERDPLLAEQLMPLPVVGVMPWVWPEMRLIAPTVEGPSVPAVNTTNRVRRAA